MIQLNGKQIIAIVGAIISVLMVSSAQLTDLLGPGWAKYIVTIAGLLNMTLQSVSVALSSQGSLVRDVAAMPGIESIKVNSQANSTLASVAVDPAQTKVGATSPDVRATLQTIVKGE
jgi:hypothetical protein